MMFLTDRLIAISTQMMLDVDDIKSIHVKNDFSGITIEHNKCGTLERSFVYMSDLTPAFRKTLEDRGLILTDGDD